MTVREEIQKHMGNHIKLGFGSGFVYCDVVTENTEAEIIEWEGYYLGNLEKSLAGLLKKYEEVKRLGVEAWIENEIIMMQSKKDADARIEAIEYDKDVVINTFNEAKERRRLRNYAEALPGKITSKRSEIRNFQPFLGREVKEVYKSIVIEDCTIIIGKGKTVNGAFWDNDEYEYWKRTKEIPRKI